MSRPDHNPELTILRFKARLTGAHRRGCDPGKDKAETHGSLFAQLRKTANGGEGSMNDELDAETEQLRALVI